MTHKRAASDCGDNEFCLFSCPDQNNGVGCYNWLKLSVDKLSPSEGWKGRGQWNFDNQAESMVSHRNKDNEIASGYGGDGDRYCADSHSEDGTFSNNALGNDRASSVKAFNDDGHC